MREKDRQKPWGLLSLKRTKKSRGREGKEKKIVMMRAMGPWTSLSLLVFLLPSKVYNLRATADQPDPAQPIIFSNSSSSAAISAVPELSFATGNSLLHLPTGLLAAVARACPSSSSGDHLSRSRCCPPLSAAIYAAYAASALGSAATLSSASPILPEDTVECAAGVEKALETRRLELRRPNASCDLACCFCGIRLRPFSCSGGLAVKRDTAGRWVAGGAARRIERDCSLPGLSGCSRCLRSLYQLEEATAAKQSSKRKPIKPRHGGDCELQGISWLLAKNQTLYLPAITGVLRAMISSSGDGWRPISCTVAGGGIPLAVDGPISSSPPSSSRSLRLLLLSVASLLLPFLRVSTDERGTGKGLVQN